MEATPVTEVQIMRKTVIDGSNTSGFQRTALVAQKGVLHTSLGDVGVPTILVEEEACKIVKKDGRREPFNREKIISGIKKACQKRPISITDIEKFVDTLENYFQDIGKKEIESKEVGEKVINRLKEWDEVAYVRFASVYRQFKDIREFMAELEDILKSRSGQQRKADHL